MCGFCMDNVEFLQKLGNVEQWVGTSEKVWNDFTPESQTMETSSSITQTLSGVVTDVITEKLTWFLLSGIYPLSQESKWNTYVYICTRKVIDTHIRAFSAHCSLSYSPLSFWKSSSSWQTINESLNISQWQTANNSLTTLLISSHIKMAYFWKGLSDKTWQLMLNINKVHCMFWEKKYYSCIIKCDSLCQPLINAC